MFKGARAGRADVLAFLAILAIPWQARLIVRQALIAGQPFEYGTVSFYAGSALVLAALAVLFKYRPLPMVLRLTGMLFLAWILLGSLFAAQPLLAQYYAFLMVLAFGYYLIVRWWGRSYVIASVIMAGVIQVAVGWYQFLSQHVGPSTLLGLAEHAPEALGQSVVIIDGARILRAYGMLPHPNMFAAFAAVSFAALLYSYIVYERNFRSTISGYWRVFYLAALLFLFSGILISFSRAAFVASALLLLGWLTYGIAARRGYLIRSIAPTVVLCFAALILFNLAYGTIWWQRFGIVRSPATLVAQVELDQISFQERTAGFNQALDLLDVPTSFVGRGLGNYVPALAAAFPGAPVYAYQPVHTIYLLMLIEIGLVGIALAVWFMVALVAPSVRRYASLFEFRYFMSLLGVLLVLGLFDHFLWTSYFGMSLWWLVVGLAAKND